MTPPVKTEPAARTLPAVAPETAYRNTGKPYDVLARPFHRINSPVYDPAVDESGFDPDVIGNQIPRPDGDAHRSGARDPRNFAASRVFEDFLKGLISNAARLLLGPFADGLDQVLKAVNRGEGIDEISQKIAHAVAQGIEGALFDRYMRVIPAWVPVGRVKYGPEFVYPAAGKTTRSTRIEEEREVEGLVTASYQHNNSIPNTQWTHYWHWAFHIRPLPGYRHVIGKGNRRVPNEGDLGSGGPGGKKALREVLQIYGQVDQSKDSADIGAIECLWDVGGFSQPKGDGGSDGVMFHGNWPFWPMDGDHLWVAGRWAYDCARVGPVDNGFEPAPTMINPIKALAVARYEGLKFPENASSVPAVRFLFFASSEGGHLNFRPTPNRRNQVAGGFIEDAPAGERRFEGINLRDRDYEFIVDLPPSDEGLEPFPIGRTSAFMTNTLVVRPRLLVQFRFAPFATANFTQDEPADFPKWNETIFNARANVFVHDLQAKPELRPRFQLIPNEDPAKPPRQVKVTVPLSKLPLPNPEDPKDPKNRDPKNHPPEAYGVEMAFGWYDPVGTEAAKLTRVIVDLRNLRFHSRAGDVNFKACVNGHWRSAPLFALKAPVPADPSLPADDAKRRANDPIRDLPPTCRKIPLFLPPGARIAVTCHGSWRHGYGEYLEQKNSTERTLKFGALVELPKDLNDLLDSLQKLDDKGLLPPDQKKRLEDLKAAIKTMRQFVGEKEIPDWTGDIDADRSDELGPGLSDQDRTRIENERVSAIARALWADPISAFNQLDEPVGWTTFVDPLDTPLTTSAAMTPPPGEIGTIDKLLAHQAKTGPKVTHVNVFANRFWRVGSGNNLGVQVAPFKGEDQLIDYSLEIELDTRPDEPPPRPTPKPSGPRIIRRTERPAPLSVYAQNTALLPRPLYKGVDRDRAIGAIQRLIESKGTDLVGLGELWPESDQQMFIGNLGRVYPASAQGAREALDIMGSGLLLLSRHPISVRNQSVYKVSTGFDSTATKGIVHARITPAGSPCPFDVFLTHTQSPYGDLDDQLDADRFPPLLFQLKHIGAFVGSCRDYRFPAVLMGDLNVADDATTGNGVSTFTTLYLPMMFAFAPGKDLWLEKGNHEQSRRGVTNDKFRGFDSSRSPLALNDPIRLRTGDRLDYFIVWPGDLFEPDYATMGIVLAEHAPGRDISDHYGIEARQTSVIESVANTELPISLLTIKITRCWCLSISGGNPLARSNDDEVRFDLGCRTASGISGDASTPVIEHLHTGVERQIDSAIVTLSGDPGAFVDITLIGTEVGGFFQGDTRLGRTERRITREELIVNLGKPFVRVMPRLTQQSADYAVELSIDAE